MTNKSIDINQRIPLETLHVALESYLNGTYSDEYILEQLRLHFKGENRLKKSLRIVKKIIVHNPIRSFIETHNAELVAALKSKTDRNVIVIALLNTSFVFSYDVLTILGKLFKVQDRVNSESLLREVSKVYGSNRALPNGLYSVVPMFLEANFFKRPKQGLYEFSGKMNITNEITQKLYIESYKIHNELTWIQDYQLMEPYFEFLIL